MKIYWSYRSVPELQELPKKEAKAIWKICYKEIFDHHKKTVWKSFGLPLVVMLLWGIVSELLGPFLPPWLYKYLPICLVAAAYTISVTHHVTKDALPLIRQALAKRNLPVMTPMNASDAAE